MACELHAVTKLNGPGQVPIHLKILQNLEKVCASILQFYHLVASNLPGCQGAGGGREEASIEDHAHLTPLIWK